jgi:hypothetical protein
VLALGIPLILRRSADQYPQAGWPRTDTAWVVLNGPHVIGSISQVQGGPSGAQQINSFALVFHHLGGWCHRYPMLTVAVDGARFHAWSRVKRVIPWRTALPSISGRNGV